MALSSKQLKELEVIKQKALAIQAELKKKTTPAPSKTSGIDQKKLAEIKEKALVLKGKIDAKAAEEKKTSVLNKKTTVPSATVAMPELPDPTEAANRINKFNSALNVAVDQARQQRKDKVLDFMGGVVPPGALSATSFAGVLSSFKADSAPLEASLINSASNFAQEQERLRYEQAVQQQELVKEERNSIRDLAISIMENGGTQEGVDAVLATTDLDTAMRVAAGALKTKAGTNMKVDQIGSQLVTYDPADPQGTIKVLYSAPEKATSGGGGSSGGSTYSAANKLKLEAEFGADWMNTTTREQQVKFLAGGSQTNRLEEEMRTLFPTSFASKVLNELDAEKASNFMIEYQRYAAETLSSPDPELFLKNYKKVFIPTKGNSITDKINAAFK